MAARKPGSQAGPVVRPGASSQAEVADQNGSAGVSPGTGGVEQGGGREVVSPALLRLAFRPRQRRLPGPQHGRQRGVDRHGAAGYDPDNFAGHSLRAAF